MTERITFAEPDLAWTKNILNPRFTRKIAKYLLQESRVINDRCVH